MANRGTTDEGSIQGPGRVARWLGVLGLAAPIAAAPLALAPHPGAPVLDGGASAGIPAGASAVVAGHGVPPVEAMAGSATWVATWTDALVAPGATGRSAEGFDDQTVRQVVHTSVGGSALRIRVSNEYGTGPLVVDAATVAVEGGARASLAPGSEVPLTVGGSSRFVVPAGQTVATDPAALVTAAGADLDVSMFFADATGPASWHPLALTTNAVAGGDHAADVSGSAFTSTTSSWWFLAGVDTAAPAGTHAVVALGASTSDGEGSTANADDRWVDDLTRRLDVPGASAPPAVVDQGIAGNRLLASGPAAGPSGDARFAEDVLGQPGVATVVVSSLGNDDIGDGGPGGAPVTAAELIAGYQDLIDQAHAAGLRIVGATLTPDQGAGFWTPAGEAVREQVNRWILTSGAFDATVDFAGVVADPADPERLAPAFDSGDHLHMDDAGYAAIAAAFDLAVLDQGGAGRAA